MVRSVEGDSQSWQGNDTAPPTTDRGLDVNSSPRIVVDDDLTQVESSILLTEAYGDNTVSALAELDDLLVQRKNIHTEHDKDQAWTAAAAKAKTYGDDMIKRWNSEIDFYLLFAALFSAILTAFNVQSYQLLQPTPAADPTTVVLQHIAQQLSSFSINPPFLNSTHPSNLPIRAQAGDSMPPVPRSAIWLNILWFSSLILSLASSVIGILVKQWLNEYSWSSGSSREAARLRQYRLDNLLKWHVGGFIVAIPVLLLLSLRARSEEPEPTGNYGVNVYSSEDTLESLASLEKALRTLEDHCVAWKRMEDLAWRNTGLQSKEVQTDPVVDETAFEVTPLNT